MAHQSSKEQPPVPIPVLDYRGPQPKEPVLRELVPREPRPNDAIWSVDQDGPTITEFGPDYRAARWAVPLASGMLAIAVAVGCWKIREMYQHRGIAVWENMVVMLIAWLLAIPVLLATLTISLSRNMLIIRPDGMRVVWSCPMWRRRRYWLRDQVIDIHSPVDYLDGRGDRVNLLLIQTADGTCLRMLADHAQNELEHIVGMAGGILHGQFPPELAKSAKGRLVHEMPGYQATSWSEIAIATFIIVLIVGWLVLASIRL